MWYIFKLEELASYTEGSSYVEICYIYYIFYHLQNICIMDKQRNARAASLMSQHKQFLLCHFLLKDKNVRRFLCHGKIQQSKFSSQVQWEDKESQKLF